MPRLTPYQSQYVAWQLSRRTGADSADLLASPLVDAQVDLNPHQVEAALFAFHSPLSKGVILADEVGVGKTIEAGLVIAQRWAERKRRILIVVPANLRKQWHQELQDKFSLHALILESRSYSQLKKEGHPLAQALIEQARQRSLPTARLRFSYDGYDAKVSTLQALRGASGWLALSVLTAEALGTAEDHLLLVATNKAGQALHDENAEDLKGGLENEMKELDREIKDVRRTAAMAATLEDKRNQLRRRIFDRQDEIDTQRSQLIDELEGRLSRRTTLSDVFIVQWELT